jgi:uncharacterized phage protein gp47/JayE
MLDQNGFQKKSYADLVSDMQNKAKELWGDDVNVSQTSFLGILIVLFAWFLSMAWEAIEDVYNAGFITKSEGVQLDRLSTLMSTSRDPAQSSYVTLTIAGASDYVVEEGAVFATPDGIMFETIADLTLDASGNGTVDAVSTDTGAETNVAAGTITVQANPDSNIASVTNLAATTGGSDQEADIDLRDRLLNSTGNNGIATPDSIVEAVREVTGVRSASISVNNTTSEQNGQPAKSFQVFTLGGDPQAIVDAIFAKAPAGIEPYGTAQQTVTDLSGNSHIIGFTPAQIASICVEVALSIDNNFDTVNGQTAVIDQIIQAIGGTASDGTTYAGLNMGDDIIIFQLEKAMGNIDGIVDATVKVGRDWSSLERQNLQINANEVAEATVNSVSVVIN